MIQLDNRRLCKELQKQLDDLQAQVDAEDQFEDKVKKAQSLWSSKGGSAGKKAFEEIKGILESMTVAKIICNYCEHNEANDIEHIYPNSFFPEKAFVWENYLLACKQCNTGHKLDKCNVLDTNHNLIKVRRGSKPPFDDMAIINPRIEDPNDYMMLNSITYKYEVIDESDKRLSNKAFSTLEILQLNKRDSLLAARKSTYREFYNLLSRLISIINAPNFDRLEEALIPDGDAIDPNLTLEKK